MNEELTQARQAAKEEIVQHTDTKRTGWCDLCTERMPCSVSMDQETIVEATTEILRLEAAMQKSIDGIRLRSENVGRVFQRLHNALENDA